MSENFENTPKEGQVESEQTSIEGEVQNASVQNSSDEVWELRLYVAGITPKSVEAFANLKKICEDHLAGKYHIEVIDLLDNPRLAKGDQILAIPTLVRRLPPPLKKIIGDLSDTERVLVGLNLRPLKNRVD